MKTSFIRYFLLCITLTLALPSCTIQLQNELNIQKEHIAAIEKELMRARKNRANHSSEIDQIKRELQFVKGSIEENSHLTQQAVLELKTRIENLSFSVNQTQGRVTSQQQQPVKNPKKEPQATPVSNIKSKQHKYDEAYALYKEGNYSKARKLFEDFLKAYPKEGNRENVQEWLSVL